jgi:hypothetical protein
MKAKDAFEEFGISKTTFTRYMNKIFALLDVSNMKELKLKYQLKQITESTLRKTLSSITFDTKGNTPNLLPDEESLLVATAEMKCYASKPQQMKRFAGQTNMLLRKLVALGVSHINPDIKSSSKLQYVRRVVKRVIARKPDLNDECDPKRLKLFFQQKAIEVKGKRLDAFNDVMHLLKNTKTPVERVLNSLVTDKLKLVYQHLGGKISKLPDGKKTTFVSVLMEQPVLINAPRMDPILEETTESEKEHVLSQSVEDTNKNSNICDINQPTEAPETTTSKPKLPFAMKWQRSNFVNVHVFLLFFVHFSSVFSPLFQTLHSICLMPLSNF